MNKYYKVGNTNWYIKDNAQGVESIMCFKHAISIENRFNYNVCEYKKHLSSTNFEEISEYSYNRIRKYVLGKINSAK